MYAKIKDGVVEKFPYSVTKLKADNPNTSFPAKLTDAMLEAYGIVKVELQAAPTFDQKTQRIIRSTSPTLVDGVWTLGWVVFDKTPEQVEAGIVAKSKQVRAERNNLLTACDWTQVADAPVDKAVWATYRQALRDVTSQDGFPFSVIWPTQP